MKKSAIFSVFITVLFLVCTSTSFSQLEVDSNGKASIGPWLEINYGGSIETGQVTIESGGECDIYNNGEIKISNNNFKAELGSMINIHSNGKISIKE